MPRLPDVPSVVRFRLMGFTYSSPWVNIFHMRYTGSAPTSAELDTVIASVITDWETFLMPLFHTSASLNVTDATDLTATDAAVGSVASAHTGTRAGTPLPVNAAIVLSYHTSSRWRGGHFRNYLAAGVTADLANGKTLQSTPLTAFNSAAAGWANALAAKSVGGRTWSQVGVRYRDQKVALTTPLILPITSASVHDRLDSQRRRLGKESV